MSLWSWAVVGWLPQPETTKAIAAEPPAWTLEEGTLTVEGGEIVAVRGPRADLEDGLPLIDDTIVWSGGEPVVWSLAPGVYAVTVIGPMVEGGRSITEFEITVDEPGRLALIRDAIQRRIQADTDLRTLRPTFPEIITAMGAE
jgi:hypothetical protein